MVVFKTRIGVPCLEVGSEKTGNDVPIPMDHKVFDYNHNRELTCRIFIQNSQVNGVVASEREGSLFVRFHLSPVSERATAHAFRRQGLTQPTWCYSCAEFIRDGKSQAMVCKWCEAWVHSYCVSKVRSMCMRTVESGETQDGGEPRVFSLSGVSYVINPNTTISEMTDYLAKKFNVGVEEVRALQPDNKNENENLLLWQAVKLDSEDPRSSSRRVDVIIQVTDWTDLIVKDTNSSGIFSNNEKIVPPAGAQQSNSKYLQIISLNDFAVSSVNVRHIARVQRIRHQHRAVLISIHESTDSESSIYAQYVHVFLFPSLRKREHFIYELLKCIEEERKETKREAFEVDDGEEEGKDTPKQKTETFQFSRSKRSQSNSIAPQIMIKQNDMEGHSASFFSQNAPEVAWEKRLTLSVFGESPDLSPISEASLFQSQLSIAVHRLDLKGIGEKVSLHFITRFITSCFPEPTSEECSHIHVYFIHNCDFPVPFGFSMTSTAYITFLFRTYYDSGTPRYYYNLAISARSRNKVILVFSLRKVTPWIGSIHPTFFKKQISKKHKSVWISQTAMPFAPFNQNFTKYDENQDIVVTFTFHDSCVQLVAVDELQDRSRVGFDVVDLSIMSVSNNAYVISSMEWEGMDEGAGNAMASEQSGLLCHFLQRNAKTVIQNGSQECTSYTRQCHYTLMATTLQTPQHTKYFIGSVTIILGSIRAVGSSSGSGGSGRVLVFYSPILEDVVYSGQSKSDFVWPGVLHLRTVSDDVDFLKSRYIIVIMRNSQSDTDEGCLSFSFIFFLFDSHCI
jgi:hypothetical protein